MISIDTEIIRNLVVASTTANNAIIDAVETLNFISIHNDWACKEKDVINDYTNANKNRIRQLQENAGAFLREITVASAAFEEAENSISDMFSSVETMISSVLSTTSGANVGVVKDIVDGREHTGLPTPGISSGVIDDILDDIMGGRQHTGLPNLDWKEWSMPKLGAVDGLTNPFDLFNFVNLKETIPVCIFSDIDLE